MPNHKKMYLSYQDVEIASRDIASQQHDIDYVVGIVRGGVIPAYLVSSKLNVPLKLITWQTRDGTMKVLNDDIVIDIQNGKRVLFVDDINDTGNTLNQLNEVYSSNTPILSACIINKISSSWETSTIPTLIASDSDWVVFPWEG